MAAGRGSGKQASKQAIQPFSYLHFVKVGKAAEAHYFQGMQTKKVWSQA